MRINGNLLVSFAFYQQALSAKGGSSSSAHIQRIYPEKGGRFPLS
jgi:hypothetical protein